MFVNALAAALGIAFLVAASPMLCHLLRWGGGAFLLWLAWESWRDGGENSPARAADADRVGRDVAVHDGDGFEHRTIRFDHITTRKAAQRRFVDLHMHMPASWTLGRAAALRTSVEQALMSAVPGLRATIQLLPSDVEVQL